MGTQGIVSAGGATAAIGAGPEDQLAYELTTTLGALMMVLRRRVQAADSAGIAQLSAMAKLHISGSMRIGELADREGVSMPTASVTVTSMVRDGLAERSADPDDRRAVIVSLTDKGRAVLTDAQSKRRELVSAALTRLSADERQTLAAAVSVLESIGKAIENPEPS